MVYQVIQAQEISLDIFFEKYVNEEHRSRDGECCWNTGLCFKHCISSVKICLQSQKMEESSCPHGELSFTLKNDNQMFSADDEVGRGNVSNPISFQLNPVSFAYFYCGELIL